VSIHILAHTVYRYFRLLICFCRKRIETLSSFSNAFTFLASELVGMEMYGPSLISTPNETSNSIDIKICEIQGRRRRRFTHESCYSAQPSFPLPSPSTHLTHPSSHPTPPTHPSEAQPHSLPQPTPTSHTSHPSQSHLPKTHR
jgi:hypothetical protein